MGIHVYSPLSSTDTSQHRPGCWKKECRTCSDIGMKMLRVSGHLKTVASIHRKHVQCVTQSMECSERVLVTAKLHNEMLEPLHRLSEIQQKAQETLQEHAENPRVEAGIGASIVLGSVSAEANLNHEMRTAQAQRMLRELLQTQMNKHQAILAELQHALEML